MTHSLTAKQLGRTNRVSSVPGSPHVIYGNASQAGAQRDEWNKYTRLKRRVLKQLKRRLLLQVQDLIRPKRHSEEIYRSLVDLPKQGCLFMEQLSWKQYVRAGLWFSPRNQHPSKKKNCQIFVLLKSSHFLRTEKYTRRGGGAGDRPGHDLVCREHTAHLSMSTSAP